MAKIIKRWRLFCGVSKINNGGLNNNTHVRFSFLFLLLNLWLILENYIPGWIFYLFTCVKENCNESFLEWMINSKLITRMFKYPKRSGRMDNSSFFDCSSPFCFMSIQFPCTSSIPYKIWPYHVYLWACGKNGWLSYGQKGVDGRSQWGTRETEVRLDGWGEGGVRQQRNDYGGCAKDRKSWRALVHM